MALTRKQQATVEYMAYCPELKQKEIAVKVGINESQICRWKRNVPEFMETYHRLCEQRFREIESLAIEKLRLNVDRGQQNAIEYVLDYTGYKAPSKLEADVHTDININIGEDENESD